jgi:hypothetical protein
MKVRLGLAACAASVMLAGAGPALSTPDPASTSDVASQLKSATTLYQKHNFKGALDVLNALVATPDFQALDDNLRGAVLTMQAFAALVTGDKQLGSDAARRATALPDAPSASWTARFLADASIGDADDALASLTTSATKWPKDVGDLGDENIVWALRNATGTDLRRRSGLAAEEALYDAHWRPKDDSIGWLLYPLAIELLAKHEDAKAAEVARQITSGDLVLRMRVDHRFDAVTGLDPVAVKRAYVKLAADDAASHPRSLAKSNEYISALIRAGDGKAALASADQAIAKAKTPGAFDDQKDQLVWTLNDRAWALSLLGRHDDAARQMADASKLPEDGRLNVSQSINLGDELYRLDRPNEALAAVAAMTRANTSPYGFNAAEEVRACAAAELKDAAAVAKALENLNGNRQDNPASRIEGLLCAGDLDQAASGLVAQLADPETRGETLVELQDYQDPPDTTVWWKTRKGQIATLRQRPDVRAAIDAAGWIRSWPFPSPEY